MVQVLELQGMSEKRTILVGLAVRFWQEVFHETDETDETVNLGLIQ